MLKNYFKTAWRNLTRNKVYSLINISGISIGLAAFWLIALYVGDELSYDHSFNNSDRIYRIAQHAFWDKGSFDFPLNPPPLAPALTTRFKQVEEAARIDIEGGGVIKYNDKIIKQDDIWVADSSFFKIFSYHFLKGDATASLNQPGSVVVTQSFATKIFGADADAFGKTIYFGDEPVKITGIIEDLPQNQHMQFSAIRSFSGMFDVNTWQNFYLYTYILVKKGTDIKAFEKKLNAFGMNAIAKDLGVKNYHMELQPLTSIHLYSNLNYELSTNSSVSRVYIFSAIAILVLLIALINYMNLATARSATRIKEIGIRKVIGSSLGNLAWLFIAEALLITCIATLISFVLVEISLPYFNALAGKSLFISRFGTYNTIVFVVLFALVTGLLSGSYPAFFLSRFKTISSLKGQLGNIQNSALLRKSLVVFQFVIAVFLISSSFIIYKQLQYVNNKDLGFNKEQVLTFHIDDMKVRNEIPALKSALLRSPLIQGVAAAGNTIGTNYLGGHDFSFEKNGAMQPSDQMAKQLYVDEDFVKTAGINLAQGRNFSKDMQTDKSNAILINETLMHELGYKNAIGKKAQYRNNPFEKLSNKTIVGVVKDFHVSSLQHKIEPLVMMMPPATSEQDNIYIKVAPGKVAGALAYIKKTYATFDNQNTADFTFLDETFAKQYAAEQKQEQLSFVFTLLAFLIACLGLSGLVIFTTSQRVKEIGIRKVLGASVGSVTVMLSKNFMQLITIATIIAIPIAWFAMNKWLQDFAYKISIQWWMLLLPGLLALCIALITVCVQSIKAAIANPVKSLRTE